MTIVFKLVSLDTTLSTGVSQRLIHLITKNHGMTTTINSR
jgi:hypothetical protein